MALINCPGCGKEVSDKAFECPQCGRQLKEEEVSKKYCEECGQELGNEDEICPKCGCPTMVKEKHKVKNFKFNNKKILICIIVVIAVVGLAFCVKSYRDKAAEKAKEEERVQASKDYATNLELVSSEMLSGHLKQKMSEH